jgi:arginine decarboxylase
MMFSTQSTHKLLAGLSQASQILVQDRDRKLDRDVFNEAFLMHTSTSRSTRSSRACDVAAAMMEAPGGTALVEESILEAIDFRRAMRKVDAEFGEDWWFKVWGPDYLAEEGIGTREDWMLQSDDRWHGFGEHRAGLQHAGPDQGDGHHPGLGVDGKTSPSRASRRPS